MLIQIHFRQFLRQVTIKTRYCQNRQSIIILFHLAYGASNFQNASHEECALVGLGIYPAVRI